MKIASTKTDKKYISFGEPFTLSTTVTMGSSESLALSDGMYGWVTGGIVIANEFYKDLSTAPYSIGYEAGRFLGVKDYFEDVDLDKWINSYSYDTYWIVPMYETTDAEAEKGESGYIFSDVVSLAAGKSKSFSRECQIDPEDARWLLYYINGCYNDDADHKFSYNSSTKKIEPPKKPLEECYLDPIELYSTTDISSVETWDDGSTTTYYNTTGTTRQILDYTKRRFPFRLAVYAGDFRENTNILQVLSSTTATTLPLTSSDADYTSADLGCFILLRYPPQINGFEIIDNWCGKSVQQDPESFEIPKFLIAKGLSELIFKPTEIITDTEVDPNVIFSSCSLKISRSDRGEVFSITSTDSTGIISVSPEVFSDQGLYSFIYTVFDSVGESTQITGEFYAEEYEPPKITFSVERVILERDSENNLGYKPLISDEGICLRTCLKVSNSIFKNPFGTNGEISIPNQIYYKKNWINNDVLEDVPLEDLPSDEADNTSLKNFDFFNKYHLFSEHIISENNSNQYQYFQYSQSDNIEIFELNKNDIEQTLNFFCGPKVISEDIEDLPYYFFEYANSNEYQLTLTVQDYFRTYSTEPLTIERTGGLLNIELGGIAIGMRHPTPLNDQAPSVLINYPVSFLNQIIFTEGVNVGMELPKSGIHGQLFFKYTL